MSAHKKTFLKDYFTDYYTGMVGSFDSKDLQRNYNWFWGWFPAVQNWFDFTMGKKRKVLEVGAAIGGAARILAEKGFVVTATDVSPYAIKKAKKINQHHNLSFEVLDVETSKKYTKKYDLIFGFEVIEHVEKIDAAFAHFYRMLKPGGKLILSTPYPYGYVFADKTHVNVRHPLDWMRIMKQAGFKKTAYKQVGFIPFFYRFSKHFHLRLPFGVPIRYINSTIFLYAQK